MFDSVLSIIAPHRCLVCGHEGSLWCDYCQPSAPAAAERCFRCHALSPGGRTCLRCRRVSPLFSVQSATRYEATPKRLIWKLKFERAYAAALPAAMIMAARLDIPEDAIVTHIPTSTNHVRRRGYDQARLLARRIAKLKNSTCQETLMRLGQQEQHSASRLQRLTQLQNAFQVVNGDRIWGRHVVLIDDVLTTGATLDAAARTLKSAGAKRITALVFAQA